MIPKVIHYCWFGRNPKPVSVQKCIESWKKYLPDYEIREWNNTNFEAMSVKFTAEAMAKKKYAFVSDYVRLHALYKYGGVYLDTDVKVLKSFNNLLNNIKLLRFLYKLFKIKQYFAIAGICGLLKKIKQDLITKRRRNQCK